MNLTPSEMVLGLFLLTQAGVLVAILARITTKLEAINTTLSKGDAKFGNHINRISNHENRITILETRYGGK